MSTATTPSWIEEFERVYAPMLADRELMDGPPITWGSLVEEARRLGAAAERALTENAVDRMPDDAAQVLVALRDADLTDLLGSLPIREGFHPRFLPVFEALPTGRRLRRRLAEFVGVVHRRMLDADALAHTPRDVAESAYDAAAWLELGLHHAAMQWAAHGRRVYVLGRHTAELLARTDLPAMPVDEITVPMPAFYLRLPAGMYRMRIPGNEFPVDGVLVVADRTAGSAGVGRQFNVFTCPDSVKEPGMVAPQWRLTLPADRPVSRAAAEAGSGSLDDRDPIPNLVFGFLLYLMSEHPLLEPVPGPPGAAAGLPGAGSTRAGERQGRRAERDAEREASRWEGRSRLGFVRVGRDTPPSSQESLFDGSGATLGHLVWVRGHWRNQAHGPGRALRRYTWIEPHTRGPDVAEQLEAHAARVQDARAAAGGVAPRDAAA